ncbi:MAG TPA: hypothetical protein VMM81_06400, partial [Acidimicrobiia bacterium]|nr:hypothetical protein [Acidimicrobiia bacterium]
RALGRIEGLLGVCLSVVSTDHLDSCRKAVAAVKETFPEVVVIVGGGAFTDEEQAREAGADGFSLDAVGAADVLVALVS